MRRNYTTRKSNMVEYYDTVYDHIPDRPEVSRFINHPRKLVTINLSADPYRSWPVEIFNPETNPYIEKEMLYEG